MAIAKWHGVNGEGRQITITRPRPASPAGTPRAHRARRATPGSPARSRAPRSPSGSRPTPAATDDPLHVRHPSLDARLDRSPPGGLAARRARTHLSPAWGAETFLGALGGGALALLLPLQGRRRCERCCRSAARRRRAPPRRRAVPGAACRSRGSCATPRSSSRCARPRSRSLPGPQDEDVDLRRHLPGADDPAPGRRAHRGHLQAPSCPPRRASSPSTCTAATTAAEYDGQPGGLTQLAPALLLLPDPAGAPGRGESGNDLLIEPGARENLRLRPDRGRPARARRLPVVPRPPPRPHRPQRLARPGRDVDRRRRARRLAAAAARRARHPADDRRPQLRPPQPAHRPLRGGLRPPADGIAGNRVLVNGAHLPHHRVSARRYRLRILNASQFRTYNLFLSNGAPLVQIAHRQRPDAAAGAAPRDPARPGRAGRGRRRLRRRSPASRWSCAAAATAAATPHGVAHLRRRADAVPGRLAARRPTGPASRAACGRCREWAERAPRRKPDRTWTIAIGGLFKPTWLINGRTFNPARADAFPALGTTETWEIVNRTAVAHMMHMHHTDWYLLSRDGRPPPPWEDCLKETFFVFPGERILVAGHFSRLHRQVRHPLPHARPRGPRPDEPVRGRPLPPLKGRRSGADAYRALAAILKKQEALRSARTLGGARGRRPAAGRRPGSSPSRSPCRTRAAATPRP